MNTRSAFVALVALNAAILAFQFARAQPPGTAPATPVPDVLRARSFELVDDQGRTRAELRVLPADPHVKMPDGTTGYPETVLLRLVDSHNGPNVKLATTEDGAGLVLGSRSGTYIQLLARGEADPFVKIVTKDGREKTLKP